MYLYSGLRNGYTENRLNGLNPLAFKWEFVLPSFPQMGVESFPCFDENGNIYFGSHDCCFYSVNKDGKINWSYSFKRKVYSSPAYYYKKLYFIGGDGYLHCLDTEGKRLWSKNLDDYSKNAGKLKNIVGKTLSAIQLDEFKFFKVKGWASPIVTADGQVLGLGLGNKIFSFNHETGNINWSFKFKRFGFPNQFTRAAYLINNRFTGVNKHWHYKILLSRVH